MQRDLLYRAPRLPHLLSCQDPIQREIWETRGAICFSRVLFYEIYFIEWSIVLVLALPVYCEIYVCGTLASQFGAPYEFAEALRAINKREVAIYQVIYVAPACNGEGVVTSPPTPFYL